MTITPISDRSKGACGQNSTATLELSMNANTNYSALPTLKISKLDADTYVITVVSASSPFFSDLLPPVLDIVRGSIRGVAAMFDNGETVAPAIVLRPKFRDGNLYDLVRALDNEGYDNLIDANGAEMHPGNVDPHQ
jgi:hypothetical protein